MIDHYFPYTLSLHAPAVLTLLGGDPNSLRTLSYIPGSALRGFVAKKLSRLSRDPAFQSIILDGTVRFLNAYPRIGNRRSLPTPVSLRIDKSILGKEVSAWDLAAFAENDMTKEMIWPSDVQSPLPDPFLSLGAADLHRVTTTLGGRVHQQRDRLRGRAWTKDNNGLEEAHGSIFSVEYIEAGQDFDGLVHIRVEDEETSKTLAHRIKDLLHSHVLLGRSRLGGYGGDARIVWGNDRYREVEGKGLIRTDLTVNSEFRALLVSSYVGRNPQTGQIDPAYLSTEFETALGGSVKTIRRCLAFELVGGFNRKWRLETLQALACVAGSVVILKAIKPIPFTTLQSVENAGLGQRRVEGFGRVVFLEMPVQAPMVLRAPKVARVQPPRGDPPEVVVFAERRIVDMALDRIINEEAVRYARDTISPPTQSLIGRLRNAMKADPATAISTLTTWLLLPDSPSKLRHAAMSQLEQCRMGDNSRLSDWIRKVVEGDDSTLFDRLRLNALTQRYHVISEESVRSYLQSEDRMQLTRVRLIDSTLAVLARAQRTERTS